MAVVAQQYIDVDERGVARLAGKRIRVTDLVMDKLYCGWGPEEIQAQHPGVTLAEVHAAFAYYYDHKTELDVQMERDYHEAEALRRAADQASSPVIAKLRAVSKLP